jgi:SH3-like domain-containing protein
MCTVTELPRRVAAALGVLLALFSLSSAAAQPRRQPPYWASIHSGRAMMRVGPGQNYRGIWLYVRPDLPVRVVDVYQDWRKIEDPDGTTGWMLVSLLSDTRTAIVRGGELRPMHAEPDGRTTVRYRAEPGVVGRLSQCAGGWCRLDVGGRAGFIRTDFLWGLGRNETIE